MIQAAYVVGGILGALAALLLVGVVILTFVAFANVANCDKTEEPDCDDIAQNDAVDRAFALLPVSVLVGAAAVALINDSYRKVWQRCPGPSWPAHRAIWSYLSLTALRG